METMMRPFLETLGRNSAEAGVLVLAVLLAQRFLGKKIGPQWRCALWLLVLVRLFLPVSVSSVASVFNLFPRLENVRPTVAVPSLPNERLSVVSPARLGEAVRETDANPNMSPSGSLGLQPLAEARALANPIPGVSAPVPVQISWLSVIFTTWLTGTLFCGGYILVSSLNMRRQFANLARVVDGDLLDLLRDCRDRLGIREGLSLAESPDVATPALYGFFKPKLLLPRGFMGRFSPRELRFILLHELAHVKRRDILFNWLAAGLQILHWFNPLIWFGFARWRLDRELACDALALETAGGEQNKEYGETILRLVENFTHRTAVPGLIGILEDKKQLQWRIRMIADFRPGPRLGLVAVALFAVLGVVCLTDAQNKSPVTSTRATNAVSAAMATGTEPVARPVVTNGPAMKVTVRDDATGQPLDHAEVLGPNQAAFYGGRENAPRWLTDQSGTAVIRLGETPTNSVWQMSWFTLSVRKEGYAASGMSWSDGSADVRLGLPKEVTVRLKHGTTAGGVVVDEFGAPQPGIQVRAFGSGYSYARWQEQKQGYSEFWNDGVGAKLPVTDAAGRWQVKDFPADLPNVAIEFVRPDGSVEKFRYPAEAENPNEPQGAPIDLTAMLAGTARSVLKSGFALQGLTVDSRGRPVSAVRIKIGYGLSNIERAGEVRSDTGGHFVLQHLNHRQVILTAEASGYAVTSLIVDLHSNLPEARLQMDDLSPLRIHVVDGDGKAITGAKVTAGAYRTEGQLLDFSGDTDERGDLTWTNAPRSKYALAAESLSPVLRQKIYLTPGQHEVTFHLRAGMDKGIIINGQVHDAKTGAEVKLESVKYQDGNRRGFQYDAEVSKSGFHLALQARWLRSGMYPSFQLQIKAAGYGTLTTPWRDYDEGDWETSFALQAAEVAGGIVSLPDGRLAAGTRLWTRAEDMGVALFMNQPGRYYGDRMIKAQADEAGRYTLPEVPDEQPVIFTDAGGFLATSAADVRHNPNVHLQPWGRVEGILKIAGQPKGNVGISLETLLWSPKMGYQVNYRTTTTADGNFIFTNIPAGEYKFYRDPAMRTGRATTEDHQMPLVVRAGETTKIEYSNAGRAVIGQARADKAALAVDWLNDDHTLTLKQPALEKFSVNPKDFATSEAYQAAYNDSYHSPERLKQSREARTYVLVFEGDGSFRADDVPAGTYELKIQVTKPDPNAHFNPFGPGHVLGSMTREVVVPPGNTPFDLGTLVIPMKGDGDVAILGGAGLTGAQGTDPTVPATSKNPTAVLNHMAGISGRVVDVGGRPVNNVQVAIYRLTPRTWWDGSPLPASSGLNLTCAPTPRIFNPDYGHPMADLPQASEPWSFCTTDVQGHFYLNDFDQALGLLAVSESGFGWTATNGFSTNMTVTLGPWGRIEGTLWHYNEVVTHEPVQVFFASQDGVPSWGPESGFNAKTDGHGSFSFDFVPPGHFGVNGAGIGEYVIVKSGETAIVKLGGSGRPVVGKFNIRNPDGGIEPADQWGYCLTTSMGDLGAKTNEALQALRQQSIWENTFTNFHIRPVQCAKDGSFRIDQVEPGKYALIAGPPAMATTNKLWPTGVRQIEIPVSDPKKSEPLDLGFIELSLKSQSGSN